MSKTSTKCNEPYTALGFYPCHTYKNTQNEQESIQNKKPLKMHTPSNCLAGQAPTINVTKRRPNMRRPTLQVEDDDDTAGHLAMELLSKVTRQLLPRVSPQPIMVDPTANNSAGYGNNKDNLGEYSGENNIVSNIDNNIVGES